MTTNNKNNKAKEQPQAQPIDTVPANPPQPQPQQQAPDWAADVPAPVQPPSPQTPAEEGVDPYAAMLKREYMHAVNQEIVKAIQKCSERFARLLSQERTPTDVASDNLGNTSDDYERIVNAYQSGNSEALANSIDELYQMLDDLDFTQMRKLDAIKQEYNQQQQQQS